MRIYSVLYICYTLTLCGGGPANLSSLRGGGGGPKRSRLGGKGGSPGLPGEGRKKVLMVGGFEEKMEGGREGN